VKLQLTQNQTATVDDVDADLATYRWCAAKSLKTFYAKRGTRGKTVYLHKVVAARKGIDGEVDHKDRNGLNCRRDNLRPANHSQNIANQGLRADNKSGSRGVYLDKQTGRWRAQVQVGGKRLSLGRFSSHAAADEAVRAARKEAFGEFAA